VSTAVSNEWAFLNYQSVKPLGSMVYFVLNKLEHSTLDKPVSEPKYLNS